jgi:hypothetical protein
VIAVLALLTLPSAQAPAMPAAQTWLGLHELWEDTDPGPGTTWALTCLVNTHTVTPPGAPSEVHEHWHLAKVDGNDGGRAFKKLDPKLLHRKLVYLGTPIADDKRPVNDELKFSAHHYQVDVGTPSNPVTAPAPQLIAGCSPSLEVPVCEGFYGLRQDPSQPNPIAYANVFMDGGVRRENYMLDTAAWKRVGATYCIVEWYFEERGPPIGSPASQRNNTFITPGNWTYDWAVAPQPPPPTLGATTFQQPPTPPSCPP